MLKEYTFVTGTEKYGLLKKKVKNKIMIKKTKFTLTTNKIEKYIFLKIKT